MTSKKAKQEKNALKQLNLLSPGVGKLDITKLTRKGLVGTIEENLFTLLSNSSIGLTNEQTTQLASFGAKVVLRANTLMSREEYKNDARRAVEDALSKPYIIEKDSVTEKLNNFGSGKQEPIVIAPLKVPEELTGIFESEKAIILDAFTAVALGKTAEKQPVSVEMNGSRIRPLLDTAGSIFSGVAPNGSAIIRNYFVGAGLTDAQSEIILTVLGGADKLNQLFKNRDDFSTLERGLKAVINKVGKDAFMNVVMNEHRSERKTAGGLANLFIKKNSIASDAVSLMGLVSESDYQTLGKAFGEKSDVENIADLFSEAHFSASGMGVFIRIFGPEFLLEKARDKTNFGRLKTATTALNPTRKFGLHWGMKETSESVARAQEKLGLGKDELFNRLAIFDKETRDLIHDEMLAVETYETLQQLVLTGEQIYELQGSIFVLGKYQEYALLVKEAVNFSKRIDVIKNMRPETATAAMNRFWAEYYNETGRNQIPESAKWFGERLQKASAETKEETPEKTALTSLIAHHQKGIESRTQNRAAGTETKPMVSLIGNLFDDKLFSTEEGDRLTYRLRQAIRFAYDKGYTEPQLMSISNKAVGVGSDEEKLENVISKINSLPDLSVEERKSRIMNDEAMLSPLQGLGSVAGKIKELFSKPDLNKSAKDIFREGADLVPERLKYLFEPEWNAPDLEDEKWSMALRVNRILAEERSKAVIFRDIIAPVLAKYPETAKPELTWNGLLKLVGDRTAAEKWAAEQNKLIGGEQKTETKTETTPVSDWSKIMSALPIPVREAMNRLGLIYDKSLSDQTEKLIYEEGLACLDQEKYADAAVLFAEISRRQPLNLPAFRALGCSLLNLGEYDAAESMYKLILDRNRVDETAKQGLGLIKLLQEPNAETEKTNKLKKEIRETLTLKTKTIPQKTETLSSEKNKSGILDDEAMFTPLQGLGSVAGKIKELFSKPDLNKSAKDIFREGLDLVPERLKYLIEPDWNAPDLEDEKWSMALRVNRILAEERSKAVIFRDIIAPVLAKYPETAKPELTWNGLLKLVGDRTAAEKWAAEQNKLIGGEQKTETSKDAQKVAGIDLTYSNKPLTAVINQLIGQLRSDNPLYRAQAADALAKHGVSSVSPLVEQLSTVGEEERKDIMDILVRIGSPAVPQLLNLLGSNYYAKQYTAAEVLGRIKDSRAVLPLISEAIGAYWLDDTSYLFKALVQIGEPSVLSLIKLLGDEDFVIRILAARALGEIGDKRAIKPLEERLIKEEKQKCIGGSGVLEDITEALNKLKTTEKTSKLNDEAILTPLQGLGVVVGKIRGVVSDSENGKTAKKIYREGAYLVPKRFRHYVDPYGLKPEDSKFAVCKEVMDALRRDKDKAIIFRDIIAPVFAKISEGAEPIGILGSSVLDHPSMLTLISDRTAAEKWAAEQNKLIGGEQKTETKVLDSSYKSIEDLYSDGMSMLVSAGAPQWVVSLFRVDWTSAQNHGTIDISKLGAREETNYLLRNSRDAASIFHDILAPAIKEAQINGVTLHEPSAGDNEGRILSFDFYLTPQSVNKLIKDRTAAENYAAQIKTWISNRNQRKDSTPQEEKKKKRMNDSGMASPLFPILGAGLIIDKPLQTSSQSVGLTDLVYVLPGDLVFAPRVMDYVALRDKLVDKKLKVLCFDEYAALVFEFLDNDQDALVVYGYLGGELVFDSDFYAVDGQWGIGGTDYERDLSVDEIMEFKNLLKKTESNQSDFFKTLRFGLSNDLFPKNSGLADLVENNLFTSFTQSGLKLTDAELEALTSYGAQVVLRANSLMSGEEYRNDAKGAVQAAIESPATVGKGSVVEKLNNFGSGKEEPVRIWNLQVPSELSKLFRTRRAEIVGVFEQVARGSPTIDVAETVKSTPYRRFKLRKITAKYPKAGSALLKNYDDTVKNFTGYFNGDKTFKIVPVTLMLISEFGEDVFLRFLAKDKNRNYEGYEDLLYHLISSERDGRGNAKARIKQLTNVLGIPKDVLGEVLVDKPLELKNAITHLNVYNISSETLKKFREKAGALLTKEEYVELFRRDPNNAVAELKELIRSDFRTNGLANIKKEFGANSLIAFLASDAHTLFKHMAAELAEENASKLSILFTLGRLDAEIFGTPLNAAAKPYVLDYLNENKKEIVSWFKLRRNPAWFEDIVMGLLNLEEFEVRRLSKEFLNGLFTDKETASKFKAAPKMYYLKSASRIGFKSEAPVLEQVAKGMQVTIALNLKNKFTKDGLSKTVTPEILDELCLYGTNVINQAARTLTKSGDASKTFEEVENAIILLGIPENLQEAFTSNTDKIIKTYATVAGGGLEAVKIPAPIDAFIAQKIGSVDDRWSIKNIIYNLFINLPNNGAPERLIAEELITDVAVYVIEQELFPENPGLIVLSDRDFVKGLSPERRDLWEKWEEKAREEGEKLEIKKFKITESEKSLLENISDFEKIFTAYKAERKTKETSIEDSAGEDFPGGFVTFGQLADMIRNPSRRIEALNNFGDVFNVLKSIEAQADYLFKVKQKVVADAGPKAWNNFIDSLPPKLVPAWIISSPEEGREAIELMRALNLEAKTSSKLGTYLKENGFRVTPWTAALHDSTKSEVVINNVVVFSAFKNENGKISFENHGNKYLKIYASGNGVIIQLPAGKYRIYKEGKTIKNEECIQVKPDEIVGEELQKPKYLETGFMLSLRDAMECDELAERLKRNGFINFTKQKVSINISPKNSERFLEIVKENPRTYAKYLRTIDDKEKGLIEKTGGVVIPYENGWKTIPMKDYLMEFVSDPSDEADHYAGIFSGLLIDGIYHFTGINSPLPVLAVDLLQHKERLIVAFKEGWGKGLEDTKYLHIPGALMSLLSREEQAQVKPEFIYWLLRNPDKIDKFAEKPGVVLDKYVMDTYIKNKEETKPKIVPDSSLRMFGPEEDMNPFDKRDAGIPHRSGIGQVSKPVENTLDRSVGVPLIVSGMLSMMGLLRYSSVGVDGLFGRRVDEVDDYLDYTISGYLVTRGISGAGFKSDFVSNDKFLEYVGERISINSFDAVRNRFSEWTTQGFNIRTLSMDVAKKLRETRPVESKQTTVSKLDAARAKVQKKKDAKVSSKKEPVLQNVVVSHASFNDLFSNVPGKGSEIIRMRRMKSELGALPSGAVRDKDSWIVSPVTGYGSLMLGLLPYRKGGEGADSSVRALIQQAIDLKNKWVNSQENVWGRGADARINEGMKSLIRVAEKLTDEQVRDVEAEIAAITSGDADAFVTLHDEFVEDYIFYFSPKEPVGVTNFVSARAEPCAVDYHDAEKTGMMYAMSADYAGEEVLPQVRRKMNAALNLYAILCHERIETLGRERANHYVEVGAQNVSKYCELGEGVAIYFSAKLMEEQYGVSFEDAVNLIYVQHLFGYDPAGPEYKGQFEAVKSLIEESNLDTKVLLSELVSWSVEAWKIQKEHLTPYSQEQLNRALSDYSQLKSEKGRELYMSEKDFPSNAVLRALTTYKLYQKETDPVKARLAVDSIRFLQDINTEFNGGIYEHSQLERHATFRDRVMPG